MFSALDLRSLAGLATIWFTLMVSPYYPLSLSSATMANSAALLSTYHLLYSLFLILAYGCFIGIRRPLAGHRPVWLRRLAGAAGFVGCLFFLLRPDQGPNLLAFDVIALALTAFSTAFFFIAWLAACSQRGRAHSVLTIGFSFVVFSALWIVLIFLGKGPLSFVSTLCPLLSLALLEGTGALPRETPVSESVRSLRPLPWGLIALLVVFIFFGALSVRLFTTMGSGIDMIGLLQPVAKTPTP